MANKFCRNISNSYRFNLNNQSELYYQPCCWVPYNKLITDAQSLVDARQEMSRDILKNPRVNCNECMSRERNGYRTSGRKEALNYIPNDAVDGDPYMLEFQLDTNCNAACSMCGPQFSSLWQKQLNIIPLKDTKFEELHNQLINLISFDLVKQIKFFGGEPLLTESHLTILNQVTNPSDCELFYCTNGSIFPNEKVLLVWQQFKKVRLSFSIDAINDQFEYIRWPLKWSRVESNLINVAQQLSNIEVRVHCTVNPMNVLYVTELEQWIDQIQKTHDIDVGHSFSPCFGVWGIDAITPELTEKILTNYPADHPVVGIVKSFKHIIGKDKDLRHNMDKLDSTRKLDWKKTFSDAVEYFGEEE